MNNLGYSTRTSRSLKLRREFVLTLLLIKIYVPIFARTVRSSTNIGGISTGNRDLSAART
jgi:hypothetical protein